MARGILVKGIVQGVGFRPFVYRLAGELGIRGWVLNAVDGVHIHAEAPPEILERFCRELETEAPAAALVSSLTWQEVPDEGAGGFSIKTSDAQEATTTFVSPDLATCPDCLSELLDRENRRFHYPFTNCTNCGPRFTIIEQLPYDRANTAMAEFELCEQCALEYGSVADRRFHAQPNACFECGPHATLVVPETGECLQGKTAEQSDALIRRAAKLLEEGKILAVKGLGGYYLACDAANGKAVQCLRERKQRPSKPLAVMFASLEAVEQRFAVNSLEAELLTSTAAPIVLLRGSTPADARQFCMQRKPLAYEVSCGLGETGVLLPATPLHHLLLRAVKTPLVMTSGNISEEPIIGSDELAQELLGSVADAFLLNNRRIVSRYDDSVVRVLVTPGYQGAGTLAKTSTKPSCHPLTLTTQFVRRARGYAPRPLTLPEALPQNTTVLAVGPEQKNTFCLARGSEAFVSQHLGNLENASSFNNQLKTIELYERLFDLRPTLLACDLHPQYLSTKWAEEQAHTRGLPLVAVQHHHAHIAAVLAEHAYEDEVIGLALDGTGYGTDGSIWGGEVLITSLAEAHRFAHLEPFPLPGGAQAIKHPLRATYALLLHHNLAEHPAAAGVRERLGAQTVTLIEQMIEQGINAPLTSSAGRLFDAVSALLSVCEEASYEGEPAILLEAAAQNRTTSDQTSVCHPERSESGSPERVSAMGWGGSRPYQQSATLRSEKPTELHLLSTFELVHTLLNLLQEGTETGALARFFHEQFMELFVSAAKAARSATDLATVALSGGVFNNRLIATELPRLLRQEGFAVLEHKNLPPNDGCIAYGQAAVAAAGLAQKYSPNLTFGGATL